MRKRINLYCTKTQKKRINQIKQEYSPNFSSHVDSWLNSAIEQIFLDTSFADSEEKNVQTTPVYLSRETIEKLEEYLLKYFGDRKHKGKFIKSLILSGQCRKKICSKKRFDA